MEPWVTTDELISVLSNDIGRRPLAPAAGIAVAFVPALAFAAFGFFAFVGLRPDVGSALATWQFGFKFVVTTLLVATALYGFYRSLQPGSRRRFVDVAVLAAPLLLLAGVAIELASLPSSAWAMTAIGKNAMLCLTIIPSLGVIPFVAILLAARIGAPTRPALTGLLAGLVAGGIAATFYAANCTDDSPLFVLTWYPLAIGALGFAGMAIGPLVLRW